MASIHHLVTMKLPFILLLALPLLFHLVTSLVEARRHTHPPHHHHHSSHTTSIQSDDHTPHAQITPSISPNQAREFIDRLSRCKTLDEALHVTKQYQVHVSEASESNLLHRYERLLESAIEATKKLQREIEVKDEKYSTEPSMARQEADRALESLKKHESKMIQFYGFEIPSDSVRLNHPGAETTTHPSHNLLYWLLGLLVAVAALTALMMFLTSPGQGEPLPYNQNLYLLKEPIRTPECGHKRREYSSDESSDGDDWSSQQSSW